MHIAEIPLWMKRDETIDNSYNYLISTPNNILKQFKVFKHLKYEVLRFLSFAWLNVFKCHNLKH